MVTSIYGEHADDTICALACACLPACLRYQNAAMCGRLVAATMLHARPRLMSEMCARACKISAQPTSVRAVGWRCSCSMSVTHWRTSDRRKWRLVDGRRVVAAAGRGYRADRGPVRNTNT